MNNNKGFTLIELIMVMALVAIVAAVVVPLIFKGGSTMTVAAMARKVKADIQYAQELAMARRATTAFTQPVRARVLFDTVAESYSIVMVNDADGDNIWGEAGESEPAIDPSTRDNFTVNLNNAPYTGIGITSASFSSTTPVCTPSATAPILEFDYMGIPYCVDGTSGTSTKMDALGSVVISKSGEPATVNVTQNTGRVSIL